MNTCLFLSFRAAAGVLPTAELNKLDSLLRATPKLDKALVHTASAADDPYLKDGAPPSLVLQLYFTEIADLEAAISREGHLRAFTSRDEFPVLAAADIVQQAMLVRSFAVPEPTLQNAPGTPHCTYLVSYEGEAEDLNAWHAHYLSSHTRHMAMFPGIRELEIYTRLDWVSALPWTRLNFMQRNKVAFDSPAALEQALHSPVRHEMRADFNTFPPFTGPNKHFAVATHVVWPVS
ncbi:MAG TPA: hypothetical protein VH206_16050 [Xanthobacteraceae bacterium]|jgi:hypothetical protein|nr:hypothetical protein [Xanthobacteraceae bacterium]